MPPTPLQPAAVQLDKVSRLYGTFVALRELSLTIPTGSSVVLLGENGAGKSTLLKLISGLTFPSFGTVTVLGASPRDQRARIAYMSHATQLYDELTALENLTYFASLNALPNPTAEAAAALTAVNLAPTNPRRVGEYSQGMKQRASLARTLLTQPTLLLLDEPFSNLDIASAHSMIDRLLSYLSADKERTLILTTHQAELARPLARTTLTLNAGRILSRVEAVDSSAGALA
jgi:ABC-type multidrug transport system ATPase subunit